MTNYFLYDQRLGIEIPILETDWEQLELRTQERILLKWEGIRGTIPDRVKTLENQIRNVLSEMNETDDFDVTCKLNNEMAELASTINDLWIWYRTNESVSPKYQL